MCHILFILPITALALFFFLSPAQATLLAVPLLFVFVWLAWVTWKDMRRPVPTGIEGLMGGRAQVISKTRDGAKVLLRGELWDAVSGDELAVGDTVKVAKFERMKLVVRKEANSRAL